MYRQCVVIVMDNCCNKKICILCILSLTLLFITAVVHYDHATLLEYMYIS